MDKEKPTAISLFAGCGGDTLGLEMAGFNVVGFVEFWKTATETHLLNFDSKLIGEEFKGDITKIPDSAFEEYRGKIDVLFAGFPCQGFSHAGKKDPNDPRNKLFWDFVRAAKIIQPKWIIGENVAGLKHRKTDDGKSKVADAIVEAFREIGYEMAEPTVLKAEEYGVPQKRRRVFFVGNRKGIKYDFPKPTKEKADLRGIIEKTCLNSYPYDFSKVKGLSEDKIFPCEEGPTGKPHPYLELKAGQSLVSFGRRISPYHVEIVDADGPSKTIHCGYSFQPRLFAPIRAKGGDFIRELTNSELAQIQGFPKDFKFAGSRDAIVKQIGNAVPPKLVAEIAKKIRDYDKI